VIVRVCEHLRAESGLSEVVLSGGVFMNVLLLGQAATGLEAAGFRAYRHRLVPPNDGGLCLGQLAVAAARLATAACGSVSPGPARPC
jgi:hydrogenase maturation protein HypF